MFPPGWFIVVDVIFQFVTAMIATAVAVFALRGYRWVGERTLFYLFLSFSLLATAFFINALTLSYAIALKLTFARAQAPFFIADIGLWIYYILEVAAYLILAYSYTKRLRFTAVNAAILGGSLFLFGPIAEMIIVVLLFIITLAQFSYYSTRKSMNSLIVSFSFLLLLIANVLIIFGTFTSVGYVAGKLIQMTAFLSLLLLLYRLRGTE